MICTRVEAFYGFDSGCNKKTIAENRKKAEELKTDKAFVFEVSFIELLIISLSVFT